MARWRRRLVSLRLERVGKRYGGRAVLDGIDLTLAAETLTVFVGRNGSGKSTLLRIVAGVAEPSHGVVRGRPPRVAIVPDRASSTRLTARAYLQHLARVRGLRRTEAAQRISELADQLKIAPGLETSIQQLSRGNAQKVMLAQAFLVHPDLVVLDEPWATLDGTARQTLAQLLQQSRERGSIVVLADHGEHRLQSADQYELANGRLQPKRKR
jgi:ABC-type multidrug transport system ATPase subunit